MTNNELDIKLENLTDEKKQEYLDCIKKHFPDMELGLDNLSGVSGGTDTTILDNEIVTNKLLEAGMTAAKIIETRVCPACKAAVTVIKEQDVIDHLKTSHPEFANILI